jgi:hypothetical protein
MLETGLEESFPASDPVAVTQPPHSPHDKYKSYATNANVLRNRASSRARMPLSYRGIR